MDGQLSLVGGSAAQRPEGLTYREGVLSAHEEDALLQIFGELRWDPIVFRGRAARRTARHYGLGYDYASRTPKPTEPFPDWLHGARGKAAALARCDPAELVEALVQRYPPASTIGWHRDAPAFGIVVGLSLQSPSRLRFRREPGRTWEIALASRSGYVLDGEARTSWEHSIPPTQGLRYSITFRTLRVGQHHEAS